MSGSAEAQNLPLTERRLSHQSCGPCYLNPRSRFNVKRIRLSLRPSPDMDSLPPARKGRGPGELLGSPSIQPGPRSRPHSLHGGTHATGSVCLPHRCPWPARARRLQRGAVCLGRGALGGTGLSGAWAPGERRWLRGRLLVPRDVTEGRAHVPGPSLHARRPGGICSHFPARLPQRTRGRCMEMGTWDRPVPSVRRTVWRLPRAAAGRGRPRGGRGHAGGAWREAGEQVTVAPGQDAQREGKGRLLEAKGTETRDWRDCKRRGSEDPPAEWPPLVPGRAHTRNVVTCTDTCRLLLADPDRADPSRTFRPDRAGSTTSCPRVDPDLWLMHPPP